MPRSGYSREDPVARRSGYVSYDNNPVDRRGGQESHSGRLNLARMNEHASPDKFLPFLDPRSRHRHEPRDRLFSSTATDLTDIPSRDDLYRSEPSQEFERRTRGYNPGHFGERLPSHGSSPQLGGLDHGYLDVHEKNWPSDSPIQTDFNDYKRDCARAEALNKAYKSNEEAWEKSRRSTKYLPPQLRNEDRFDQSQSLLAAEASRSHQSEGEKRDDHNNNYIGHWSREKRNKHTEAANTARTQSVQSQKESQRHVKSRNGRWRDRWESDMDKYFPEDEE